MLRALLLALLALAPSAILAQVTTVDEGSFTVTRRGVKVGREEFRIVRQPSGGGTEYVARALGAYGDRRISPALQTDAAGAPLRYQVEVRTPAGIEERLTGQAEGTRFRAQARTQRGEAAREYLIRGTTLLVDDELFHQFYFLGLGGRIGTAELPMLMPRRNVHGIARVARVGQEAVVLAGRSIPATRLSIVPPSGSRREVWLDAAGRVLKVTVPDQELVAVRDDPPSTPGSE